MYRGNLTLSTRTYIRKEEEAENSSSTRGSTPLPITITIPFIGTHLMLCKFNSYPLIIVFSKILIFVVLDFQSCINCSLYIYLFVLIVLNGQKIIKEGISVFSFVFPPWICVQNLKRLTIWHWYTEGNKRIVFIVFRWYVDSIPIRVFKNYLSKGIPYPNQKAMRVYSSIWNADSWATRRGLDKIDWTKAPFVARLRRFTSRACTKYSNRRSAAATTTNGWSSVVHSQLSLAQRAQMNSTRNNYLVYDYCKDIQRFHGFLPGECFMPQYWINIYKIFSN